MKEDRVASKEHSVQAVFLWSFAFAIACVGIDKCFVCCRYPRFTSVSEYMIQVCCLCTRGKEGHFSHSVRFNV